MFALNKIILSLVCSILFSSALGAANNNNPEEITKPHFYVPFSIHIDPMESLLLINIENDPDSLYIGFEPQLFDDTINGKGMLIIAWRTDGYVDIYHQPALKLDPDKYDIAGKGLANRVEVPLEGAYFRVEERGVQAWFQMTDIMNRNIEVSIRENHPRKRKPFGLLAPMGDAAQNPSALPLVLLHDFYFVRQKHTQVSVEIDGKLHTPDKLPMPMDRRKMYFIRYSTDPLIATVNQAFSGPLEPIEIINDSECFHHETRLQLNNNKRYYQIEKISRGYKNHTLQMNFDPPFPNIADIQTGDKLNGIFKIEGDHSTGIVKGDYTLAEKDGAITITMNPSHGWKPRPDKISLRMMYTVAGVFKKWPMSYYWNAEISFDEDGQPFMKSQWVRK